MCACWSSNSCKQTGARPVQGRPGGLFQRFQVERSALAPGPDDQVEELPDLGTDCVLDRPAAFFFSAAGEFVSILRPGRGAAGKCLR